MERGRAAALGTGSTDRSSRGANLGTRTLVGPSMQPTRGGRVHSPTRVGRLCSTRTRRRLGSNTREAPQWKTLSVYNPRINLPNYHANIFIRCCRSLLNRRRNKTRSTCTPRGSRSRRRSTPKVTAGHRRRRNTGGAVGK